MNKEQVFKFIILIPILFYSMFSTACGELTDNSQSDVNIACTPEVLMFSYESSTQEITVTSTSLWAVSSSEEWCTLSTSNGYEGSSTITATCTVNEGIDERLATIKFSAVTYTKGLF